ncbi:reverse transcriptase domain-containing protein, partial [Tanacetum coccineum]
MGFSSAVHYELQGYRTYVWMQDHRMDVQDSLIAALTAQVSSLQGHLATTLGEIRSLQAREQARADVPEGTDTSTVVGPNNMPPKRTSAATKTARAAAAAAALMTTAAIKQLWNSHKNAVTQEVAYAMVWKSLKKLMTVKYCPRGEIKKLEIELWNLKVKGTDIPSYTLRFQELALLCGRMFLKESDEVEKYVSGLPDMIRGNVMSYRPQIMEEVIEFSNDQLNQKLITVSEKQAEQKRKIEFNARNNQGYQQQNKRQNTGRAYTAGSGEKREYTGSLPLCTKCKTIGNLAHDCRSSGPNNNNNNRGNSGATQNA